MSSLTHFALDSLTFEARSSVRLRQHENIHSSYNDPCQRLFNAIEPNSYIHPHRHKKDESREFLIAIRGDFILIVFDNFGAKKSIVHFGVNSTNSDLIGVEINPNVWHTVISKMTGSILLEVKPGPFNPMSAKELAAWAPKENTPEAQAYFQKLLVNL